MAKKKKKYVSIISDMIRNESGHKREVLKDIKKVNKKAYIEVRKNYFKRDKLYKLLQKTNIWKEGKNLLLDYFTYNDILICSVCGKIIDFRIATLHHNEYHDAELFTPDFVSFIHPKCHSKIHYKKYVPYKNNKK